MEYSYFVFETPTDCFSCPFLDCQKEHYCLVEDGGRVIETDVCDGKPDWCPLRPLPQRKETNGYEPFEIFMHGEGWNDCLLEITGETECSEKDRR